MCTTYILSCSQKRDKYKMWGRKKEKAQAGSALVRKGANRRVKKDPLTFVFYIAGLLVGIAVCITLKGA